MTEGKQKSDADIREILVMNLVKIQYYLWMT